MKKFNHPCRVLLALLLLPFLGGAQDLAARADQLLSAYHKQGKFNGTVLLAKGGKVLFEKGYGAANAQTKAPITPATEFLIGSMSKPFTAIVVLQLQERGILSIKDP